MAFRFLLLTRCVHDLPDGFLQADCDVPGRVVAAHFGKIGDVADVVADAVFIDVLEYLGFAGEFLGEFECFPDRARICAAAADVVNLSDAGSLDELLDEAGDIVGVDVIADLLALVAEDFILATFEVAFREVGEEAMKLDATVVRTGEAAAAQAGGGHAEVATVFLDHHVGCHLRCSEE